MKPYLTPRQFARVAAVAFVVLAVTVALIQSRPSKDEAVHTPMEHGKADVLICELARCRTITPDDLGLLESCRNTWAENRQHFFLSIKSPHLLAEPAPGPSAGAAKYQDGIPLYDVDQTRAR
jgi:conjugative transfer region protein TrbK